MVFSLDDFDGLNLTNISHAATPISPSTSPAPQPHSTPGPEHPEGSAGQQDTPIPTPALDPALFTPMAPLPGATTAVLRGQDLTQLARHLALQKCLSKDSMDNLVSFSKVFTLVNTPIFFSYPCTAAVRRTTHLVGGKPALDS